MLVSLFTLLVYTFNVILSKALLAMIAYTAAQSAIWTLFILLFCSQTPQRWLRRQKKNSLSNGKPYLVIIANNGYSLKVIRHFVIRTYRKKGYQQLG